jgi:hypothetical protein
MLNLKWLVISVSALALSACERTFEEPVVMAEPVMEEPAMEVVGPTVSAPEVVVAAPEVLEAPVVVVEPEMSLEIEAMEEQIASEVVAASDENVRASVEVLATETEVTTAMVSGLRASRSFAQPREFPPQGFAGFGIIAFPDRPTSSDAKRARFMQFCNAWVAGFVTSDQLVSSGVSISEQMVTVMPLNALDEAQKQTLTGDQACDTAVANYGLTAAQSALAQAAQAAERTDDFDGFDDRGPYLLAWSPGSDKGQRDVLVLVADLTNSSTQEQIDADMRAWRTDIQQNPELWRRGWNIESTRRSIQRWVDRRGAGLMRLWGGS